MNIKKSIALLILIFMVFPVFAANKNTAKKNILKQKLTTINSKLSNTKKKLAAKRAEKKEAYGELKDIDDQLEAYQSKIAKSQIEIKKYQHEIDDIDKNISMIEKNLERRNKLLRDRVVDMYKGGDMQYINVLLNTTDMWSFLTQSFYVKKLIEYDTQLIEGIKRDKAEALEKKNKREKKLAVLKEKQSSLISVRNKHDDLAKAKKKQIQGILNDIEKEAAAYKAEMASSKSIENQILAMQRTPQGKARMAKAFSGKLGLPCSGRITSRFGWRFHPIRKQRRLHTGVDIGAPSGTAIHASGSGTVILSGWNGPYGKAVIIDHGGGVTTLYGHCSSLNVRRGQAVSKGQVIAKVGSTGWSTGPHCHFEKRINGKPVNPL